MSDAVFNLNLLYDNTIEVADGIYGITIDKKYGFIDNRDKSNELLVDAEFDYAIYTEYYIGLWSNRYASNTNGVLYLIPSGEIFRFDTKRADAKIAEHSALEYKLLTLVDLTDDEKKRIRIIDTHKGKVIANAFGKISYRPGDPNIIIGYDDIETNKALGITRDLKVVDIVEYLSTIYSAVKVERARIMCKDSDGNTIKLNKYGQSY